MANPTCRRLARVALACLTITLMLPAPARAWARHDLVTQAAIAPLRWLDRYRDIPVTAYTYKDPGPYGQRFQVRYLGAGVGRRTSARDILVTYTDEPDWALDQDLQLSRLQAVMGGSQGYRHQRYQFIFGFVHVGVPDERGAHFFAMAREAFERGDRYWGFRFLARSLHYIQDINQPFHTRPIRWPWLWEARLSLKHLIRLGKNMHFGYEHYVAEHLLRQLQSKPPTDRQPYLAAMAAAETVEVTAVDEAIRQAALESYRQRSVRTLKANDAMWPARVREHEPAKEFSLPPEELFGHDGSAEARELDAITAISLRATARDTRSVLELARRTIVR